MERALVSSAAAAARLGIKRATLYAYVSRGLVAAHVSPGRRGSWFDPVELEALVRRARDPAERRPELSIASAVTLIENGRYWYRGRAPHELAASTSYEGVAEWLWTGQVQDRLPPWPVDRRAVVRARIALGALPAHATALDRVRVIVAVLGAADPLRADLRPAGALATARRLVATTVATLARRRGGSIASQVASWLASRRLPPAAVVAIEQALVMMADHELAASTLAVRVAASFRADPYAAVAAGLGAMAGTWHGAASRRIEVLLDEVARGTAADRALGRLFDDGRVIPGFGHPLYPDGDPRVSVLLTLARSCGLTAESDAVLEVAQAQGLPRPNADFALAALARVLRLTAGAPEALFTVGRLSGWLAHAIEEYTEPTPFRLRAVYAGLRPERP